MYVHKLPLKRRSIRSKFHVFDGVDVMLRRTAKLIIGDIPKEQPILGIRCQIVVFHAGVVSRSTEPRHCFYTLSFITETISILHLPRIRCAAWKHTPIPRALPLIPQLIRLWTFSWENLSTVPPACHSPTSSLALLCSKFFNPNFPPCFGWHTYVDRSLCALGASST